MRDTISLEPIWLGSSEPASKGNVSSFIYEMMVSRGQVDLAEEYGLLPFEISVLAPERTLCEKIMSLVRFSYTENATRDLRTKTRHVYDLHQMLLQDDLSRFFNSLDFDLMLQKFAEYDQQSFRNNNDWLYNHPSKAMIFSGLDNVWPELAAAYNGTFRTLVFGVLPLGDHFKISMKRIKT